MCLYVALLKSVGVPRRTVHVHAAMLSSGHWQPHHTLAVAPLADVRLLLSRH